jgi:hypothetical protein
MTHFEGARFGYRAPFAFWVSDDHDTLYAVMIYAPLPWMS